MVRALTSHQCGPGSNPGMDASCRLSLSLVLSFSLRGFSLDTPFSLWAKLTFPNSNLTRNQLDEEPLSECCYLYVVIYYLFIINLLWDVSFIKRVLLNKFKAPVLYVFFSCYSK